ncbi:tetratricopeptide repeat protein [Tenuifilum sp.]|uniref:tetratricopeptide repeat protein n=1 Tax=Tenuifilum sp. TaxID=2760880 RepID=UPI002BEB470B|nr:tetratricopeptide repeat-containing sensor histidine kinase [Tenuifilum sp.]HOU74154.1 tetratricopeptide repeat-containing sensor histidine kinase [Tenuifilum sp.]HPP90321.1 tetratricopeptide repeat-containing sensor histidine kinase [Tenuifilum sp.]HQE54709.1 tetratricopeptide repeat-containing sensor histidine kinase [Tenuifilum sp.]HQG72675.1 tetratricopeptide repeat-containing sensor histidine kinase [Tenuifilum sp.]
MRSNNIKILLNLIVIFYLPIAGFTQQPSSSIDSLRLKLNNAKGIEKVNILIDISKYYWDVNPDSSVIFAEKSLKEAKADGSDDAIGDAYNALGNAYSSKYQNETALNYYLKSLEFRKLNGNPLKIGNSYHNLGLVYRELKQFNLAVSSHTKAADYYEKAKRYDLQSISYNRIASLYNQINDKNKALEYAFKALNIVNENNIDELKANLYNLIGSLNRDLKNLELAEKYYTLAFKEWEKSKNISGLSTAYNNLGIVLDEKGDLQKALEYYTKSLEFATQQRDSSGIATAYNNIGFLYARIKQFDKALMSYQKSYEISVKTNGVDAAHNTLNNIASTYLKQNNLEKASEALNKALRNIPNVVDQAYKQETYQLLSDLYAKKGDYRNAYHYKCVELAYADTLYTQQRLSSIAEMQARYETETKEKEIELLKKDVELKELQFQKQRSVQQVLISLTLLLLAIFFGTSLILTIIRKKNKQLAEKNAELFEINKKLKESEKNLSELNATKDKLFSIIAHDLKNPFNALIGFSDILERNFNHLTDNEKKEYISVISESAQNLYKLLDNLLQWTRAQTGSINYIPEKFKLEPLIKQEVLNLNANAEKKRINVSVNASSAISVYADKNSIATVIRNLLSNAIKFTDIGGTIEIIASESKDFPKMAEVVVKDSGIGIDQDDLERIFMIDGSYSTKGTANETGTGLGLLLCHEFVTKNNGKIWVNSSKGSGSEFHFTIPLA